MRTTQCAVLARRLVSTARGRTPRTHSSSRTLSVAAILCGSAALAVYAAGFSPEEWISRRMAAYIGRRTGLFVSLDGSVQPQWATRSIVFRDVRVSTRHSSDELANSSTKNSPTVASGHESFLTTDGQIRTHYDLDIDRIVAVLSLKHWLAGRGLVHSCTVSGVRGIVDRRLWVNAGTFDSPPAEYVARRGDFDFFDVVVNDMQLQIVQPYERMLPRSLSVITAKIPRLRRRFLLYDLLSADSVVGIMDGSLYSLHVPRVMLPSASSGAFAAFDADSLRHIKVHDIDVAMFSAGPGSAEPPLSWLTRGSVDFDIFIQLPSAGVVHHSDAPSGRLVQMLGENLLVEIFRASAGDTASLKRVSGSAALARDAEDLAHSKEAARRLIAEIDRLRDTISTAKTEFFDSFVARIRSRIEQDVLNVDTFAVETPETGAARFIHAAPDSVAFRIDCRFHNLRAHIPWALPDSGRALQAAIMRPVIAYINEQRPFIPLSAHFDLPADRFEGAWTIYESGVAAGMSQSIGEAFAALVHDRQCRTRRLRTVSLWTLYAMARQLAQWINDAGFMLAPASLRVQPDH